MTRQGWTGAVLVGIAVAMAALAPWLATHDYRVQAFPVLLPPGSEGHLLGTDELGRDVLSRLLWGARTSLLAGLLATAVSVVVGVPVGLLMGYVGGWFDEVMGRVIDIIQGVPVILVALVTAVILGPGLTNIMIALAISWWTTYARLVRAETLSLRKTEFVEAAVALGSRPIGTLARHVLPNVLPTVLVTATLDLGVAIIVESSLSFLGLGVQPPTPSWGAMLSNGRLYVYSSPWMSWIPGTAIFLTALGFNLLGDGLRALLDPKRVKGRRRRAANSEGEK